jgi:hypothetical protein
MKPNPGYCPGEAVGKRVKVRLRNGMRPAESWAADGKGGANWEISNPPGPWDITHYEVA